jgi:hypothetical protein
VTTMMQSLGRKKKMKKDKIEELKKRVYAIELKIDDEIKFLRDYNTINVFIEDIRKEIRNMKTILKSE